MYSFAPSTFIVVGPRQEHNACAARKQINSSRPARRPRATLQPHASTSAPATPTTASTLQNLPEKTVISSLSNVSYVVGNNVTVVEDVSLDVCDGEIVCMLGPSGSGKSTLLRMLAGLLRPSRGEVLYRGRPFRGPNPGASIVFQTFALYPWLTVLENVELGLKGNQSENRERALETIDIIGLDGYENAYPRELSGGMRQRVGFARALAVQPELLCMDEPFSALDVLTAENLRSELLRLWQAGDVPTTSVLLVTHGIEEAVALADRVVVLGRDPGHIRAILPLEFPHPRNRKSKEFQQWADLVYTILSEDEESIDDIIATARRSGDAPAPVSTTTTFPTLPDHTRAAHALSPLYQPIDTSTDEKGKEEDRYPMLPGVRIGSVAGLLSFIASEGVDLYLLGQRLQLDVDDLYPIIDAAEILQLIDVDDGDVRINAAGLRFTAASIDERKQFVRETILKAEDTRLIQQIYWMLRQADNSLPQELIFDTILLRKFSPQESRRQLEIAVEWSRFAELFGYEANTGTLFLDMGDADSNPDNE